MLALPNRLNIGEPLHSIPNAPHAQELLTALYNTPTSKEDSQVHLLLAALVTALVDRLQATTPGSNTGNTVDQLPATPPGLNTDSTESAPPYFKRSGKSRGPESGIAP